MATVFVFAILKHFVPKKVNFPEGLGGFIILAENPEGRGGGITVFLKKWKNRGGGGGGGGVLCELTNHTILPFGGGVKMVGRGWGRERKKNLSTRPVKSGKHPLLHNPFDHIPRFIPRNA